jgi:hypothetical protein
VKGLIMVKTEGLPKKERLMVSRLRDFVDNNECSVALIAGIRQTGKSTILKQLKEFHYPEAVYIDLSEKKYDFEAIEDLFLNNPTNLLLLDEISYLQNYERYAQLIYDLSAGEHNRKFKVIMTGSSAAHIIKLRSTKLGGGRAKLFRIPPIMFVEYLYFTGKISSYGDYSNVQPKDFEDYLFLKGLDSNLCIQFTDDYFDSFYDEINISNKAGCMAHSHVSLKSGDLNDMANLLAYKLSEATNYNDTIAPEVGGQEHIHLSNLGIRIKKSIVDLSDTIISDSKSAVPDMEVSTIGRILEYLLYSGLAHVEHMKTASEEEAESMGHVLNVLKQCKQASELEYLFKSISICMTSPLFYTRLGSEIMAKKGIDPDVLRRGMLFGKMLELYVSGGIAMQSNGTILTSKKLKYINEDGSEVGEVDIWNSSHLLLCELGTDNKKDAQLNLREYFKDTPLIRIGSSRTNEHFTGEIHRIPYAKLCCMVDTGDIFKLQKTKIKTV